MDTKKARRSELRKDKKQRLPQKQRQPPVKSDESVLIKRN
jgi:hypothetical protein